MTIWFSTPDIQAANKAMENTACSNLGIEITEIGDDWVEGTMPAVEHCARIQSPRHTNKQS